MADEDKNTDKKRAEDDASLNAKESASFDEVDENDSDGPGEDQTETQRVDLDYVSDAKAALIDEAPSKVKYGLLLMSLVLLFAVVWSHFASIEEVVSASGKIIPSQQLQVVQHLEGGIVKQIMVTEGERVSQGQIVVTLDPTQVMSEYKRDLMRSAVLEAEIARLVAEGRGGKTSPLFSESLKRDYPNVVAQAQSLFDAHLEALNGKLEILNRRLKLNKEEYDIIAPLAREGVMSKIDLLRIRRQVVILEGEISAAEDKMSDDALDRLNIVRADMKLLRESIKSAKDKMQRSEIRSPVNGIINQIHVTSVGEVVRPGQRLMDVVPGDSLLTIQARIQPDDIGFIKEGQNAIIKVSAFNFARYGGLEGKVASISADSISDDAGNLYYEVKLMADKMYVGTDLKRLQITTGMTAQISITIGKKTVLEYMLKPFLKARDEAFKEG